MPRTEDGEYELVLGNRQLLSIFFIVVVLLGVGFTLGYMLGRGSVSATTAAAETPDPKAAEPSLPPPAGPTAGQTTATSSPAPAPTANDLKPSPVDDAPAVPEAKRAAEKRANPPEAAKPATSGATTVASSSKYKTGAPPRGAVFIQVAAVPAADAEAEAEGLAAKGYPIWVAPNERTADLFSVLVGPFTDRAELSKAKAGLEQLGFRKAFRKEIK